MKKIVFMLMAFGFTLFARAEVILPKIFNDNMVLQRDKPVKIWGLADKGEKIEVTFNGQEIQTETNNDGKWEVTLKQMTFGGPFSLTVEGKNKITLKNILIGDVWICSGQSNMEFIVNGCKDAADEIEKANYPEIRSFNVKKNLGYDPLEKLDGEWLECKPESVGGYSAVGYFFAKKVYEETGIPIGLINSSWGGTQIETWISQDAYKKLPKEYWERYQPGIFGDDSISFLNDQEKNQKSFYHAKDLKNDIQKKWFLRPDNSSDLKTCKMPLMWDKSDLRDIDGIVWFYTVIDLPASVSNKKGFIKLGLIDQKDEVWINGKSVGSTDEYMAVRSYEVPIGILHEGTNFIAVRLDDNGGNGGLMGKPEDLFIEVENDKYSLAGDWTYKMAITNKMFQYEPNAKNLYPGLLYNAMINPLVNYKIKGIIWYQGEQNAGRPKQYQTLFPYMINNWRMKWGEELPFYWVQLANYMTADEKPSESNWAELREAQAIALALPQTGQAVIIDVGEGSDIHPKNKQDVGLRVALIALNKDYGGKDIIYSGPNLQSIDFKDHTAIVSFNNIGSGLISNDHSKQIKGFAIAGKDKKFVWAEAKIDGNKVIVSSKLVKNPKAIRYAWGNNPETNLYNKEGLPACPFRTDTAKKE